MTDPYRKPTQTDAQKARAAAATAARKARDAADLAGINATEVHQPDDLPAGILTAPDELGRVKLLQAEKLRAYCRSKADASPAGLTYAGTAEDLPELYQIKQVIGLFPDLDLVQTQSITAGTTQAGILGAGSNHHMPYPALSVTGTPAWPVAVDGAAFAPSVGLADLSICFAEMLAKNHNSGAYQYTGG